MVLPNLQCVVDPGTPSLQKIGAGANQKFRNLKGTTVDDANVYINSVLRGSEQGVRDILGSSFDELGRVQEGNPLGAIKRAATQLKNLAKQAAVDRGLPEEFVVWAQPESLIGSDFQAVYLSPQGDFIGEGFQPYLVKKGDMLADVNSLLKSGYSQDNPLWFAKAKIGRVSESAKQQILEFINSQGKADLEAAITRTVVEIPNAAEARAIDRALIEARARSVSDEAWDALKIAPDDFVGAAERRAAKAQLNRNITNGMVKRYQTDFAFRKSFDEWMAKQGIRSDIIGPQAYGEQVKKFLSSEVRRSIDGWAQTSFDKDAWAIAMQRRAAEVFDMAEPKTVLTRLFDRLHALTKSNLEKEVAKKIAERSHFIDSFLHEMYNQTQAEFARLGVREVTVYRGYAVDEIPSFIEGSMSADDKILLAFPKEDVILSNVSLQEWAQPLNSFSASKQTATSFASGSTTGLGGRYRIIMGMRVPVENIIASSRTGFGCLSEYEYIVLGNTPGQATIRIRAIGSVV